MTTLFVCEVPVSEQMMQEVIDVLNEYEIYPEDGDQPLTLEEVKNNPDLLKYLCSDPDPFVTREVVEFWNADGWCDFKQYRK